MTHARKAGHTPPGVLGQRAFVGFAGPTPAAELLAWLDENDPRPGQDRFLDAYRANALAMLGRFDEARSILAAIRGELARRGGGVLLANITAFESVWVELWAGEPEAAVTFGEEGFRLHEDLGQLSFQSAAAAYLAQALFLLDRLDDADGWARRAAELGVGGEVEARMAWRGVRAKVLARRGAFTEAGGFAREAVAIGDETASLNAQGEAHADLAEDLLSARRTEEAASGFERALERFEGKGDLASTEQLRARLPNRESPWTIGAGNASTCRRRPANIPESHRLMTRMPTRSYSAVAPVGFSASTFSITRRNRARRTSRTNDAAGHQRSRVRDGTSGPRSR